MRVWCAASHMCDFQARRERMQVEEGVRMSSVVSRFRVSASGPMNRWRWTGRGRGDWCGFPWSQVCLAFHWQFLLSLTFDSRGATAITGNMQVNSVSSRIIAVRVQVVASVVIRVRQRCMWTWERS